MVNHEVGNESIFMGNRAEERQLRRDELCKTRRERLNSLTTLTRSLCSRPQTWGGSAEYEDNSESEPVVDFMD